MLAPLLAAVFGQSAPADTAGSDSAVLIIGVVLVTIVVVVVVARRNRS